MGLENGTCEHCDGPLATRWDTRGRKARFCSDACRSAAYRERKKREHADELAQARTQMVINIGSSSDALSSNTTAQIDALTARIAHTTHLNPCDKKTLEATQNLIDAAGKTYWPHSAQEHIHVLERRIEDLEIRLRHATETAVMPTLVRRKKPGLHKGTRKKKRRH